MRHFALTLALLCSLTLLPASSGHCWWWDSPLVTIDGVRYSREDFKRWWGFWKDTDSVLPKTPDPYLDWLLLAREAEQMGLANDPGFQRSTDVFVKMRSLLRLKLEEVDQRVKVTDAEVRERYEKRYTPMWLLQRLQFKSEADAKSAWQGLKDGTLSIDDLLKRSPEEGGPTAQREDWRRPVGIDAGWAERFRPLAVGQATEPLADGTDFVFYRLKVKEDGSAEDFAKLRERIEKGIWKEKEELLSKELSERLRKKFEVKVDEERLAALNLGAPEAEWGEAVIVSTNRQNVTEKDFALIARRQVGARMQAGFQKEGESEFKKQTLKGIIDQNCTDWEALERRYQEREPLKWEYDFNVKHRLTRAIEERLFVAQAKVSQEEVKSYYDANLPRFSQPETVRFVLVQDTEGDVNRVWADVSSGKDFAKALKEHTTNKGTGHEVPYNHLEPFVRKAIETLAKGEVSAPLEDKGHRFIIRLLDRKPAIPVPFEQAAPTIRRGLERKKIDEQRRAYLQVLRSRSKITVSESEWNAVLKELGEAK